jgi:hypothetical protein
MCVFTSEASEVHDTRIFSRVDATTQFLAYDMRVALRSEGAMVLPLPVHPVSRTLEFVDLSDYSEFFRDMDLCFPPPELDLTDESVAVAAGSAKPLPVEQVGAFEASFVPSEREWGRLEPRFRLSDKVWNALPDYSEFGFAVFKLRSGSENRVHPMAFRFATSDPERAYFPTIHVHDGNVHTEAEFDHALYLQSAAHHDEWFPGELLPAKRMRFRNLLHRDATRGLVLKDIPLWKKELRGSLPNQDTWVSLTDGSAD